MASNEEETANNGGSAANASSPSSSSSSPSPPRRRVKLYVLDDNGDWADQGTGFAECTPVDRGQNSDSVPYIIVISEDVPSKALLRSKVAAEEIYAKQAETLIVWNDGDNGENGVDYALSFQEASGCQEIWDEITEFQAGIRQSASLGLMTKPEYANTTELALPPANLAHVEEIVDVFQTAVLEDLKPKLASLIRENDYIPKLVDLYSMVEDLESEQDLKNMYYIFRELVLLNDPKIIEKLVSVPTSTVLMSALEHDPEIVPGQFCHNEFLQKQVQFKEVIPFEDEPLVEKIHCVYRLQYLKDVALAKVMDEATNATLASLIYVNNIQIVTRLTGKSKWIAALFDLMKSPEVTQEKLEDALRLLAELTALSLNLEQNNKVVFYEMLEQNGLFSVCEATMDLGSKLSNQIRLTAMELLVRTVENDSSSLRRYVLSQKSSNYAFLSLLVRRSKEETSTAVLNLISDVFTNLIGGELYLESVPDDLNQAWTLFYERFADKFFHPLFEDVSEKQRFSDAESLLRLNLISILISFILSHGHRSRIFLLAHHRLRKLMNLLHGRDKFIHLAAIRVIRAILSISNRFYVNALIEDNIFAPIVESFIRNGSKYNLLNSAILEMFSFLNSAPHLAPVLKYFLDTFGEKVEAIESAHIIVADLRTTYETHSRDRANGDAAANNNLLVKDETREQFKEVARAEKEEEAWFSEDEDSDTPSMTSTNAIGKSGSESAPSGPENPQFLETIAELDSRKRTREEDDEPSFFDRFSPKTKRRKSSVDENYQRRPPTPIPSPSHSLSSSPAFSALPSPSFQSSSNSSATSSNATSPASPSSTPSLRKGEHNATNNHHSTT